MTNIYLNPADVRAKVKAKGTKFMSVTFTKKCGEVRKVSGLTKPLKHIKGTGRPTPTGYVAIYSPNESKWAMFREDHVLDIA